MTKFKSILYFEVKYPLKASVLTGVLLFALMYFLLGSQNLSWEVQSFIIERFIPLISIFIMLPFFQYEKGQGIMSVLYSKKESPVSIFVVRYVLRVMVIGLLAGVYIYAMKNPKSLYDLKTMWLHTMVLCLLLGHLGILVNVISRSEILAYGAPIAFFISQLFNRYNHFKILYMAPWSIGRESSDGLFLVFWVISLVLSFVRLRRYRGRFL